MNIAILGSTGSIGESTVDVAVNLSDINVTGITAHTNIKVLRNNIKKLSPGVVVITHEESYKTNIKKLKQEFPAVEFLSGMEGVKVLIQREDVELAVNGLSGIAGLIPTLDALEANKKVAIANKESIVMGWFLIKESMKYPSQLIPVDSEHSAIYQMLTQENKRDLRQITLTASGGAVYDKTVRELEEVDIKDCLKHPNWDMGVKVTVDSATLMNKGLEVLEAHNLFDLDFEKINVYIHPQSVVHGLIEFEDGTVLAHLSRADMKIPIQYALTQPGRKTTPVSRLKVEDLKNLNFSRPDTEKFPSLDLALQAGKQGGEKPILLCAADDVAVEAFSEGLIKFTDIPRIIEETLAENFSNSIKDIQTLKYVYKRGQKYARKLINGENK
ncbi:MAG: 1-deoxy-D-xylulose-5-phosphate reductoisomerase [Elusimicrobiota bacterium]